MPPRPRHRRTPSMPTVLGPPPSELMKLTEERLRQHYAVGGNSLCIVDSWRGTQAAAATPAFTSAEVPELSAPVETQLSPVTAATPTSTSKAPPPLLGATTAPSIGPLDLPAAHVPLPSSDTEEDGMDVATCRKRCRDDVSDDDDAPCPPRKTAASEDDPAGEGHLEACDDIAGSLSTPPCEPEPTLSPSYCGDSFPASDRVPIANPAIEAADYLVELPADEPGPTESAPRCPSPRRGSLCRLQTSSAMPRPPRRLLSPKRRRRRTRSAGVPRPLLCHCRTPPQHLRPSLRHRRPSNSLTTAASPTYRPAAAEEGDFIEVLSKTARRRAKAEVTIPKDAAVVGTAMFRPSVPGGSFKQASRLALAARPLGMGGSLRGAGKHPPQHRRG
ncbi:hypothetical protein HPB50_008271 [Hyalomma asiaticum]|uniref:Uncharacterized protein n=1 Tax=Hyalomma asiaticum TaxID=266040 RepID=A0ACB7RPQ6_HYAAI|nr:hypothetical protein HPB50_008271 [Hyalomma asiaticum]